MFIDGYGVFAACRKIACLAILLAFSSSAQAIFKADPVDVTFESTQRIFTERTAQEYSYVVGEITITDGSPQTQWSIGKGKGEPKYGVTDFILSLDRPDVSTLTRTPTTVGETVYYRYILLDDPTASIELFDVIVQDGTRRNTLTFTVGLFNDPPRVYDSEEEIITSETTPTVGTYTGTFVVGEVSTIVFSANEANTLENNATAQYFTWSIIPNVDSLATVFFANTDESQFIISPQNIPGQPESDVGDVGVVYKSSRSENFADAGYTLVVRDTLGGAATVTVLLTPEPPVISYKGSSVEDSELAVSIEALGDGRSFELSSEYACPTLNPKCLSWSGDDVDISSTSTAGGDTVRVTVPEGTDVGTSFTVTVLVSGSMPVSESTVNVTIAANMPPEIVSIDGQITRRLFSVSPNLETVRFPVVATDDFDPESMTWAISNAAGSGKGTASFVVMDGMMESTATTAVGSNVMVNFSKGTGTQSSAFTLTVTDGAGLVDTATVTVSPPGGLTVPDRGAGWDRYPDVVAETGSSVVLTFRASDPGLGEKAALRWSVEDLRNLVFDSTNSLTVTTGPEGRFVFRFSPSTQRAGRFLVRVTNSHSIYFTSIISLTRTELGNESPTVTARVDDVSFSSSGQAGIIGFPEGLVTTDISFSAHDPVGRPLERSTVVWTLGEQSGVRVFFVDTNKGENVVVQFEEPPVEGNYFVILAAYGNALNAIRVDTLAEAVEQLRIRTFLGGAVR